MRTNLFLFLTLSLAAITSCDGHPATDTTVHLQKPGHDTEDAGPHGHPRRRHVLSLCDGGRPQRADHEIARPDQLDAVRHGLLPRPRAPDFTEGARYGPPTSTMSATAICSLFALLVGRHRGLRHASPRPRHPKDPGSTHGKLFISKEIGCLNSDRPVLHRGGRREIPLLGKFPRHLGRPAVGRRAHADTSTIQLVAGTAFEATYPQTRKLLLPLRLDRQLLFRAEQHLFGRSGTLRESLRPLCGPQRRGDARTITKQS